MPGQGKNKREMIQEILHLDREIAKLKGQATELNVRLKEKELELVRRKEELWQLISAANCAEEQRKDPERANLCSRGEEHNDTAAVAAGSPMPTRRPAPLAIGDHGEDSSRTIRRGPSEFGADIFHTAAENEHGDDEDDESSDSSSNFDYRSVFPNIILWGQTAKQRRLPNKPQRNSLKEKPGSRKR